MVRAIVGANWGDEGKGKITDMLAKESDIVIRFQGGSNAGHTIINNYGKFALHHAAVRRVLRSYHQHHRQRGGAEYRRICSEKLKALKEQGRSHAPDAGLRPGPDRDALSRAV